MSYWLHPRDSGPEVVQGPGGVTTSPTLLDLGVEPPLHYHHQPLGVEPAELSEIVVGREVFRVLPGFRPRDPN